MTGIRDFHGIEEYRQWLRMDCLFSRYPIEDIRRNGLERLPGLRRQLRGTYYTRLVDDWERALLDPDPEHLRAIALDTTSYGVDMRQNAPFARLLGQEDNLRIIRESRDEQRTVPSSIVRIDRKGRRR